MKSMNDHVFTTPFPKSGVVTETRASGLKGIANYSTMAKLTALADGPDGIKKGDVVYVAGTNSAQQWSKTRFKAPWTEVQGTAVVQPEGIFVPKHFVMLHVPMGK